MTGESDKKYKNSKVYKLISYCDNSIYIGSTIQSLYKRLYEHKNSNKLQRNVYKHFNLIGWEHVQIILIESFNLKNRDELRREEDRYIQLYKNDKMYNLLNILNAVFDTVQKKIVKKRWKNGGNNGGLNIES